jgi:membrane protein DedA with SNARE-associated domain
MANIGTALAPRLVTHHPALLIALDARNRHLLLVVAAGIGAVPFFTIGFFRLLVSDPLFFLLGRWYGEPALQWLEAKAGTGATRQLRWLERKFGRWGTPLVAIMPNNAICLFAGTSGMRPRTFWTLNVLGTIGRLMLIWWLGKAFQHPLTRVLDWVQRYQWPLVAISVAVVGFQAYRSMGRGELEPLGKVEDEIEALAADVPTPDDGNTVAADDNTVADDDNTDVR